MVQWHGKNMPWLSGKPTPIVGLEVHTLCDAISGIVVKFMEFEGAKSVESKEFVNQKTDVGIIDKPTALILRCLKPSFSSAAGTSHPSVYNHCAFLD